MLRRGRQVAAGVGDRRLGRGRRLLPDRDRDRRRRCWRSTRCPRRCGERRWASCAPGDRRQPRAGAAGRRPAGRPPRAGPRRRRRPSCVSAEPEGDAVNMTFAAPEAVLRYVIEKGSITVNGVSLTVTGFDERRLLGVGHPAHPRGDEPGRPRAGRSASTSRPTCSASTWSGSAGRHRNPGDTLTSGMTVDERYQRAVPGARVTRRSRRSRRRSRTSAPAGMVVVVDSPDRENEGDLVMAAECVTPEAINFMARHARGLICLTLTPERCDELGLPMMTQQQPHALRDRVHGLDRGPQRRLDRHLGGRPRPHHPGRRRSRQPRPGRPGPARPRVPAARAPARRARAHRPDRGVGRPGAAWPASRRPASSAR